MEISVDRKNYHVARTGVNAGRNSASLPAFARDTGGDGAIAAR
jgi:hypothetical protein